MLKIAITGEPVGTQLQRNFDAIRKDIRSASLATATEVAELIQTAGRAQIASAGHFGTRFINGFVCFAQKIPNGAIIDIEHKEKLAAFFEKGGLIQGKPLLWIPFSNSGVTVPPSQYGGKLFYGRSRHGTPLLFSYETRKPIYFGVKSVYVPRKFRLREIIAKNIRLIPSVYQRYYGRSRRGR